MLAFSCLIIVLLFFIQDAQVRKLLQPIYTNQKVLEDKRMQDGDLDYVVVLGPTKAIRSRKVHEESESDEPAKRKAIF